jgi:hypothetical protein
MFLSSFRAPIRWGDPVRRGPLSKQAKQFFGGSTADCLWCSKGAAGNLQGKPKPARLELVSEAAERGNYPEAKPNEERLKGRRACKKNKLSADLSSKIRTFGRMTARPFLLPVFRAEKKVTPVDPRAPSSYRMCKLRFALFGGDLQRCRVRSVSRTCI